MRLEFEWGPVKAKIIFEKHGVSFEGAITVFGDDDSITMFDFGHSDEEERFMDLGRSKNGKTLIVVHTEREDRIRIIQARPANREERGFYEKDKQTHNQR